MSKKKMKAIGTKQIKMACGIIIALILVAIGAYANHTVNKILNKKEVNVQYVSGKLEDVGELTTQQLTYSGSYIVSEGTVPFITENGFTMGYTAKMRAGIDFSDLKIKVKNKVVRIVIPHATIQSNNIDASTVQFFNEKRALLNWTDKTDISAAISEAEKDALENSDYSELLDRADRNTVELVHKILDDSVGNREVEISFK